MMSLTTSFLTVKRVSEELQKKEEKMKIGIDKCAGLSYNTTCLVREDCPYGGIAQLARAFGSYPKCHWFKSSCRYQLARWSSG